jgi:hypothetical protein
MANCGNITITIKGGGGPGRFHAGGFVGAPGRGAPVEIVTKEHLLPSAAADRMRGSASPKYPRRRDTLRLPYDGDYAVTRVRESGGLREVVCTNGARTRFVPMLAVDQGFVGHFRGNTDLSRDGWAIRESRRAFGVG